ncbi:MAG: sigma-54-dependent Fis family transcriptional regulator [Candidatus Omnitrophica bacterium]|nr:sigma-54-dependent Fis family transcriptional regulator [Candidatus Omnitrophota bacterium]
MTKLISEPHILIADDQPDVLTALRVLLKNEGFQISEAQSPQAVIQETEKRDFDVVLMDMNYTRDTTSGEEGLDLLQKLRKADDTLPIVIITGFGSIKLAVEAMKRGARDFIQKPWENERLLSILNTQVELGRALRDGLRLKAVNQILRGEKSNELIAASPVMKPVLDVIGRIGPSDANVLILGENGTGKGVVARALHAASMRADKPLITVNVGGLSEGVFTSELFGHVKGAFTDAKTDRAGRFELADGGTLFLDEIANVPLNEQTKLLRVLETGEFERVGSSKTRKSDVRILSATNADLQTEVNEGRFRQDLLYRLNTVEIELPPLSERIEDIPLLAMHFLKRYCMRYRKQITHFQDEALAALKAYSWPGNIRELDHTIERGVLMAKQNGIQSTDLALRGEGGSSRNLMDMSLEEVECFLIQKTLARHDGNVSQAAKALGMSRQSMYRRLDKYGF